MPEKILEIPAAHTAMFEKLAALLQVLVGVAPVELPPFEGGRRLLFTAQGQGCEIGYELSIITPEFVMGGRPGETWNGSVSLDVHEGSAFATSYAAWSSDTGWFEANTANNAGKAMFTALAQELKDESLVRQLASAT